MALQYSITETWIERFGVLNGEPLYTFSEGTFRPMFTLNVTEPSKSSVMHLTHKNRPELPPPFLVISMHSPDTPKAFKIRHCSNLAFLLKLNLHSHII